MDLSSIVCPAGSRKKRKRVGRGLGSGHGKTACRGTKGQRARSGGGPPPGFEGGQMPLKRRVPKRGFTNIFKKKYALVKLKDLNRFEQNSIIDPQALLKEGLVKKIYDGIKILGDGDIDRPLIVKVHKVTKSAQKKIEAAGGHVEVI